MLIEQLEHKAKLDDLRTRIGASLKAERDRGNNNRILIEHNGKIYSIERPDGKRSINPKMFWSFEFKLESTLVS